MSNILQIIQYLLAKINRQTQLIEKLSAHIDWLEDDSNQPSQPRKNTDITKLDYNKLTVDDARRSLK